MKAEENEDLREEYDFSQGERGKYAERFRAGSNIVLLDPDVAAAFKSAREVNDALREELRRRGLGADG